MKETRYRFVGGPLDGTGRRKTTPARNPIYLTPEGQPMPARQGDRIALTTFGAKRRSKTTACYASNGERLVDGVRVVTYRFITIEGARTP